LKKGETMTLTEKINAAVSEGHRRELLNAARRSLVESETPYDFYMADPCNMEYNYGRWEVIYRILLPDPDGGGRRFMCTLPASHSSSHEFLILGEEAALDFVYMMNMARINRKDGGL
jgi:hypothetical protein